MSIVIIGIDLAKNAFAVHGVGATDQPALARPNVPRARAQDGRRRHGQPARCNGFGALTDRLRMAVDRPFRGGSRQPSNEIECP